MPLISDHFTKPKRNSRLDACLVDDAAHIRLVTPRERGDHVSRIQAALFIVLPDVNLGDELGTEEYGPLTAEAVFRFKNTRTPKILNAALHQTVPDNIVGKLTIKALDEEMVARQGKTPADPKLTVTAVPLSGFSNLRLKKSTGFKPDPSQPLCQMIPVTGGFRNLFVTTGNKGDIIRMRIPDPPHVRERNANRTDPTRQLFTFGAFLPLAINPEKEINFFITPSLEDAAIPKAAGTSSFIFDEKLCWGKAEDMKDLQITARLVGHEIGHDIGLGHLDTLRGTLMFPSLKGAGDVIPAETLETLKIS